MSTLVKLSQEIGRAFYGRFSGLRPPQVEAVFPILQGMDTLVLAGTGSGKTEAILAPLVQRLATEMRSAPGCVILYLTPTRALANDLLRRVAPPLDALGLLTGARHGEHDDLARARKPDLLITTPESTDVLIAKREQALISVRAVVLDELHLTYNSQRGLQTAILLLRLQALVHARLQVAGLSATVADPVAMWSFFRPGQPVAVVRDEQAKPIDTIIRHIESDRHLAELLTQLAGRSPRKLLLFANSRKECDRIGSFLRRHSELGEDVLVHHSSLDRDVRLRAERRFLKSSRALCVATSTLELGIDIGDVDLVFLYGHPGGWESFLQRSGRGSRRAPKTNVACLVTPEHGPPFKTVLAFEALLSQIHSGRLEGEAPFELFGAALQQILSILAQQRGAFERVAAIADVLAPLSHLQRDRIEVILQHLTDLDFARRHGFQNRYAAADETYRLQDLRLLWGNFPTGSSTIAIVSGGQELGTIPADNLLQLTPGTTFRFAAECWRVIRVSPTRMEVVPSPDSDGEDISYTGLGIQFDPTNIEEMLRLLDRRELETHQTELDSRDFLATIEAMGHKVNWSTVPIARSPGGRYVYLTFAGRVLNGVIARWSGVPWHRADEIGLWSSEPVSFHRLPRELEDLAGLALEELRLPIGLTIFQKLLPPELLRHELLEIWRKTPVLARSLQRLREATLVEVPLDDVSPLVGSEPSRRRAGLSGRP